MRNTLAGMSTTNLTVRLPVALVGRLYTLASEENRDVSLIAYHALEASLAQAESRATSKAEVSSPKGAGRRSKAPAKGGLMSPEQRIESVPINSIVVLDENRARVRPDRDHELRLSRSDPNKWPPLLTTQRADGLLELLDGFSRYAAAVKLGLTHVRVEIVGVGEDGPYLTGLAANLNPRALPLSHADRMLGAVAIREASPQISDRQIAIAVGLSHTAVSAHFAKEGAGAGAIKGRTQIVKLLGLLTFILDSGAGTGFLGLGNRSNAVAKGIAASKDPAKALKSAKAWIPILEQAVEIAEAEVEPET